MIPYQIGEAGDAASLLCAVCAPAVASSMGALCAVYGRGTTSGRRGLGGIRGKRWRMQIFAIAKIIFATTNKAMQGR